MARPSKPRFYNGVELPPNLYLDSRKRTNYWRYLRPDGTYKIFQASLEEATRVAIEANVLRTEFTPTAVRKIPARNSLAAITLKYIAWRESYDSTLARKQSWQNRKGLLKNFAENFAATPVNKISLAALMPWWENLTYHQQHARRSEFNKFFNWLASNGYTKLKDNPFSSSDDRPRLMERARPTPKRERLSTNGFWAIYHEAGNQGMEGLQIAMGISLVTTMRIGDICSLTFSQHVTTTSLRKTINKSAAQRGAINAAHLEWPFAQHPILEELIKRAQVLSRRNLRCPYVVSHMPVQRRVGVTKDHICQLTPDRLTKQFASIRDSLDYFSVGRHSTPPTFHEIRALASDRYRAAGYSTKQVQEIMAHTDERVTKGYQAGHSIDWTQIAISIDQDVLGGEL